MSKSTNIISMADRTDNGEFASPEQVLELALAEIRSGKRKADKLIILFQHEKDGYHKFGWHQAKMSYAEIIALMGDVKMEMFMERRGGE